MVGQLVETYMTCFWKFSSGWMVGWLAAFEDSPHDLQSVECHCVAWLSGIVGQLVETYMICFWKKILKLVGCFWIQPLWLTVCGMTGCCMVRWYGWSLGWNLLDILWKIFFNLVGWLVGSFWRQPSVVRVSGMMWCCTVKWYGWWVCHIVCHALLILFQLFWTIFYYSRMFASGRCPC